MVRLRDIAQKAGVSIMTVSRVLHDSPDIADATKARVAAIATQMGYVPDFAARGLRTRTTRILGLVVPTVADPLYAAVLAALQQEAIALDYDLLVAQSLNQAEREEDSIQRFLGRHVDGLFIAPAYRLSATAPVYERLLKASSKVVLLGHPAPFCHGFPSVATDDIAGAIAATRHLLELGHRRIAFLAGPSLSPAAQERFEGYRRALRDARIEIEDHLVFNAGSAFEDGVKAARQLLSEVTESSAILAFNDPVAMGAATVVLEGGLAIPSRISVVGFGGFPASALFRVPLTTVTQPVVEVAAAAMRAMVRSLRGEPARTERFLPSLTVRASTAAPVVAPPAAPPPALP